jgi:hypothetical protein
LALQYERRSRRRLQSLGAMTMTRVATVDKLKWRGPKIRVAIMMAIMAQVRRNRGGDIRMSGWQESWGSRRWRHRNRCEDNNGALGGAPESQDGNNGGGQGGRPD